MSSLECLGTALDAAMHQMGDFFQTLYTALGVDMDIGQVLADYNDAIGRAVAFLEVRYNQRYGPCGTVPAVQAVVRFAVRCLWHMPQYARCHGSTCMHRQYGVLPVRRQHASRHTLQQHTCRPHLCDIFQADDAESAQAEFENAVKAMDGLSSWVDEFDPADLELTLKANLGDLLGDVMDELGDDSSSGNGKVCACAAHAWVHGLCRV